ncbi:MAG: type IV secretion system DNA-binding domain-containing protein, partial [Armatimonadota bacterium]|nr:type IV secretion system DNA-binding domain-containing protein [Armatimonadota bacterium]
MLTRLIESFLVYTFNRAKRGIAAASVPAGAGDMLLGQTLSSGTGHASVPVTLSPAARMRHLYVLGATGTGKTNLLLRLIESDIAARRTFCVIDLRGDLVDRILPRLVQEGTTAGAGERLLLIDLRSPERIVGFNPLAGPGEAYARAFHVLDVLRRQSDSWGIQLEETLRNALLALAETGWSLLEVEPLLSHPAFRRTVLEGVSDSHVRAFFVRYGQLSEDKQSQWRLPVLNKVTPLLAIPQLRLMLGQRRSFSFPPLLDGPPGRVILVALAVDRLHSAAHLVGGLLVSALQNAVMARVDQPEAARVPVHLYVDEFEAMVTDPFASLLAEGRRFGLGLCLSHQNLGQLDAALRQMLLANAHTQFYFQTGARDAGELARELATDEPKETVRAALVGQKVGEAFLVRRGLSSVRLRTTPCPDPNTDAAQVLAIRDASLDTYAQPRGELEQEMREREASFYPLPAPTEPRTPAQARPPG